jgi:hypothetical protein
MNKYTSKNLSKIVKGKKMPNPVYRSQNLAARMEHPKSKEKKK